MFCGEAREYTGQMHLINDMFGIEVSYHGAPRKGEFFVFPYMDDTQKTVRYFAFDTIEQKQLFLSLFKISGIGPKTAFHIAGLSVSVLQAAVEEFDVSVLQALPGIGPKSAKRILIELKSTLTKKDVSKLKGDDVLIKNIVKTLTNM